MNLELWFVHRYYLSFVLIYHTTWPQVQNKLRNTSKGENSLRPTSPTKVAYKHQFAHLVSLVAGGARQQQFDCHFVITWEGLIVCDLSRMRMRVRTRARTRRLAGVRPLVFVRTLTAAEFVALTR